MATVDTRLRARNRGKATERHLAKRLNGRRNGATGLATADVEAGPWAIEAKSRKELPDWLTGAMRQAKTNAPAGKTGIVILHEVNRPHHKDLVVMELADFEAWHGSTRIETTGDPE